MATQFFTARRTFPKLTLITHVRNLPHFFSHGNQIGLLHKVSSNGTDFSLCPENATSLSLASLIFFITSIVSVCNAQIVDKRPAPVTQKETTQPKPAEGEKNAAQIELLETKYRFETNGDSRKEVHARVRINNELGVRQFARLNFDFNRKFQSVEIPQVRVTHASGGIADILPSAITDSPNPAVINAPAYLDVRVKSVRVLGLEPGDLLEYQVITTTTNHPLAPDFWLEHTFDRTGVVSHQIFSFNFPTSRNPEIRIEPTLPATSTNKSGVGEAARTEYWWDIVKLPSTTEARSEPDISLSTEQWEVLSVRLDLQLILGAKATQDQSKLNQTVEEETRRNVTPEITAKALELTRTATNNRQRLEDLYDFVSQKITTVDLPLGATGFAARPAKEIMASGYATPEDKFALFAALTAAVKLRSEAALTGFCDSTATAQPLLFNHLIISANDGTKDLWLDPSLEVAPFGVVPANSGKCAFLLNWQFYEMNRTGHAWQPLKIDLPFPSAQKVLVKAHINAEGVLIAKVRYIVRGDNELLLRVAFHKTPKEKWKDVAQMLALSDGFRGQVAAVTVSDPYATHEPFQVEYEIRQPKFADWSKKPVRIPALLPLPGLPDAEPGSTSGSPEKPIDLGTPLDIQLEATVQLPEGTTAQAPIGTSVDRDYATFSSKYSVEGNTLHATRRLHFILHEIPAARAADWNAFLHAVQADQTQLFMLQLPATN